MEFTQHPLGVPNTIENAEKINKILQESFSYQKTSSVSNACGFVNVILNHCFKAAGITVNVVYGTAKCLQVLDVPHVWLTIEGHIVDNTYVEDIDQSTFIALKRSQVYEEGSDGDTLFLGDQSTRAMGIGDHNRKLFRWLLKNQDKCLIMCKNRQCLRFYYDSMVAMMKEKYDVDVPEVPNQACWSCGEITNQLQHCIKCKFARYCGKTCQKKDWKHLHRDVCLPPNTP